MIAMLNVTLNDCMKYIKKKKKMVFVSLLSDA